MIVLKKIIKQWKNGNYNYVYETLKTKNYDYTLDNLVKDFSSIKSKDKSSYLIYLLSRENTPQNAILLCDALLYTDTFFFDIHPVIHLFLKQSLMLHPFEISILKWIISVYDNNPDSPFSHKEINIYKDKLNNL